MLKPLCQTPNWQPFVVATNAHVPRGRRPTNGYIERTEQAGPEPSDVVDDRLRATNQMPSGTRKTAAYRLESLAQHTGRMMGLCWVTAHHFCSSGGSVDSSY